MEIHYENSMADESDAESVILCLEGDSEVRFHCFQTLKLLPLI